MSYNAAHLPFLAELFTVPPVPVEMPSHPARDVDDGRTCAM